MRVPGRYYEPSPSQQEAPVGYRGIKTAVGPALEILYQPWIRGEENIPAEGAAILASNHLTIIDFLIVYHQ